MTRRLSKRQRLVLRVALAVLLTGESPGDYGTKEDNTPVLPPVEPVVPTTG